MANALDDYDVTPPGAAAPPPAPAVVGAPEPGSKDNYQRAPTAPGGGPNALDDYDVGPPPSSQPFEVSHPLFGQAPGDYVPGASPTFWHHAASEIPLIGDPLHKLLNDFNAHDRAASLGIPQPQALAEIEGEQEAGTRAHPGWATGGNVVGGVGGLAAMIAAAPEAFGVKETTKTAGAIMGGISNLLVKRVDDEIRGKKPDPTELGLTAAGGALGGAFSAALNGVLKPGLEELGRAAVIDHKIRLPAGLMSDNPLLARLPSQLLTGRSGALAVNDWHKAITATIGEDAPRLTTGVLAKANQRLNAAVRSLPPGATIGQHPELIEQMRNVRVLENVLKKHPDGIFSPQEFSEAVQEGVDAIARNRSETFALDGGGEVAKLAKIGTAFLKSEPAPKWDRAAVWHAVRQGLTTIAPAVGHHLYAHGLSVPDLTTAGIITGAVTGAKLLARGAGSLAARSSGVTKALVSEAPSRAAAIVRPVVPALIQQSVPLAESYLSPAGPQRNFITRTRPR
jgi:hypothetical protein